MELKENFWIELKETQSGHQILTTTINGKHWRGFLETREGKRENGETYTYKSANMRPLVLMGKFFKRVSKEKSFIFNYIV